MCADPEKLQNYEVTIALAFFVALLPTLYFQNGQILSFQVLL